MCVENDKDTTHAVEQWSGNVLAERLMNTTYF